MYDFPSKKREENFPLIRLAPDTGNDFINWFHDHTEIERRIPPIYQDFVIEHKAGKITYRIFIHYTDDITRFEYRVRTGDKTLLTGYSDYAEYCDDLVHTMVYASISGGERYGEDWLKQTALATVLLILGVQAYMLYCKPEIVEKIYNPSAKPHSAGTRRRKASVEPVAIRRQIIRRIFLTKSDKPDRKITYRKLSWSVRGHYRHCGAEKKLKYIQPQTRSRGGKITGKPQRTTYTVESPEKKQ